MAGACLFSILNDSDCTPPSPRPRHTFKSSGCSKQTTENRHRHAGDRKIKEIERKTVTHLFPGVRASTNTQAREQNTQKAENINISNALILIRQHKTCAYFQGEPPSQATDIQE